MSDLACIRCIAEFEQNERERPDAAFVVYRGDSLCSAHFNVVRGHAADFVRYPVAASPTPEDGPDAD